MLGLHRATSRRTPPRCTTPDPVLALPNIPTCGQSPARRAAPVADPLYVANYSIVDTGCPAGIDAFLNG